MKKRRIMNLGTIIISALILNACSSKPDPQDIVNKTIQLSGGDKYIEAMIEFDFRDVHYKGKKSKDDLKLTRRFKSEEGEVYDIMTKDFFQRSIKGKRIELEDSLIEKYRNSINSVFYFARLPYGLNDEAVKKRYLDEVSIGGNEYHKIEVTFDQNGGGKDFKDVFVYWVNTSTYKVDYFAYFYEVDGGGLRFRKAYNERFVEGIRFVDYVNYKANPEEHSLFELGRLYEKDELKELSRIELKNVRVVLPSS